MRGFFFYLLLCNLEIFHPHWKTACRFFAYNVCEVGLAAGPVLYVGAVTRVMDGACYSQVICIIFTVATKLLWEPLWATFFPPFSRQQITFCQNPSKVVSLFFRLSPLRHDGGNNRLVFDATEPLFPSLPLLQSTLLRTVIHFSFRMFPGYTSLFPSSLHLLYLALCLALPPQCDGFMLQCTFRLCVGWCCGLASGSLW